MSCASRCLTSSSSASTSWSICKQTMRQGVVALVRSRTRRTFFRLSSAREILAMRSLVLAACNAESRVAASRLCGLNSIRSSDDSDGVDAVVVFSGMRLPRVFLSFFLAVFRFTEPENSTLGRLTGSTYCCSSTTSLFFRSTGVTALKLMLLRRPPVGESAMLAIDARPDTRRAARAAWSATS